VKPSLLHRMIRKEIGLAIDEREIALSQVAMTTTGWVEVLKDRTTYEPDGLAQALEKLLSSRYTREELERAKVVVGLPALRVFFSTRPIQVENLQASPEALLHEVFQSPTLSVDDMVVDLIKSKPGLRPLASIVACRKKYLAGVLAALAASGVVPSRVEPSPCALLREAARRHHPPKKSRAYIRVFLGSGHGLAILMAAPELPLLWRPFSLPDGGEAGAILATVGSMRIMGSYCGLDAEMDAVLIHGRADLLDLAEVGASPAMAGIRVNRHDEPALDVAAVVSGLLLSERPGVEPFNLVKSLARRTSFLDLFPWGQALVQAAVLFGATFWLLGQFRGHAAEAVKVKSEVDKYAWAAKVSPQKLAEEKKVLEQQVDAIRAFGETRITWTEFTRDIASKLPNDLALNSFTGQYDLEFSGTKANTKPKRFLTLGLNAPISRTGAMPREIDAFLRILRADRLLKRDFPDVELADLRWTQTVGKPATANFSVVCQPSKAGPSPTPPAAAAGK
jgi:hypothetical protein